MVIMILRAIIWKEWREHGVVLAVLAVFAVGMLTAVAVLADPPNPSAPSTQVVRYLGLGRLSTVMLAVTAGMVCGAAVFAGEREAGTFSFLDSLPWSRAELWRAKVLTGGLLAFGLWLVISITATLLGLIAQADAWLAMAIYTLIAYAWGVFGSTLSRSTLTAVGVAIIAAMLVAVVILVPLTIWYGMPGTMLIRPRGVWLFVVLMVVVPLTGSAWRFTAPDRRRVAEDVRQPVLGRYSPVHQLVQQWLHLLWLVRRQLLVPAVVLAGLAVGCGLLLLVPMVSPVAVWPAIALALGVLVGVVAFADEQVHGSRRYWAEQRLNLWLFGLVKLAVTLLGTLGLLLIVALPGVIQGQFDVGSGRPRGYSTLGTVLRSPLLDDLGPQGWKYVLLPAVYGWAAGVFCGQWVSKRVVAAGVAMVLGGLGSLAWGPSLLAGGLHGWQVWLPPAALAVAVLLSLHPWATERLHRGRGLGTMCGGVLAAVILLAVGLAWRVLEVPSRPDAEDDIAFVQNLPPFDDNPQGRDMKAAAEQFARQATALAVQLDNPAQAPRDSTNRPIRLEDRLENVLQRGWPGDDADPVMARWLDELHAEAAPGNPDDEGRVWYQLASDAAHPAGIYEYPQMLSILGALNSFEHARRMAVALIVRGLQQQSRGRPEEFVRWFAVTLSLSSQLRNAATLHGYFVSVEVERLALIGVERWLEAQPLPDRASLGQVYRRLLEHDDDRPFDPRPFFLAERYLFREAMNAPEPWLSTLYGQLRPRTDETSPEIELVMLAWMVPWERERVRRLLGHGLESGDIPRPEWLLGRPGVGVFLTRMRRPADLLEQETFLRVLRRAVLLRLALADYYLQHGRYPETPQSLLGGLMSRLPADPYEPDQPLHYRLSGGADRDPLGRRGEFLRNPPPPPGQRYMTQSLIGPSERFVPENTPIIWSVGYNRTDEGGRNLPITALAGYVRTPDILFVVPPLPRP